MRTRYDFREEWEVPAPPARVAEVVTDVAGFPAWWPQVRSVTTIDDDRARLRCRSSLPYTLDLVLRAVSRELPALEVELSGSLEGYARWRVVPAGAGRSRMVFEQEVDVTGLLVPASYLARPLLERNHARMMRDGRRGLTRVLAADGDVRG